MVHSVFIGMPVYNGEKFLREAVDSIRKQAYGGWKLLISDNASNDKTAEICESYCRNDGRISYSRQNENRGAADNFRFVLNRADCGYFMWAAADDVWDPEFVNAAVNALENRPDAGFAFSNIVNIDSFGRVVRTYPDFGRFGLDDHRESVENYASDPEYFGKANLIYSVYRTNVVKSAADGYFMSDRWGSDMSFVLAVLSRAKLLVDSRVLFRKRYARPGDSPDKADLISAGLQDYRYVYPPDLFERYASDQLDAARNTPYYDAVDKIMRIRSGLIHERLEAQKTRSREEAAGKRPVLRLFESLKRFIKG